MKAKLLPGKFSEKGQAQLEEVPFKKLVFSSLALNIATLVFLLAIKNNLPPEIPLFYGRIGEEQLAPTTRLAIPGLISIFIIIINLTIASLVEDDFLRKTLILAGVASVFFSIITTVKIALLVGSF
jgi:hypothetical protein